MEVISGYECDGEMMKQFTKECITLDVDVDFKTRKLDHSCQGRHS
jgi:hypothetical protein